MFKMIPIRFKFEPQFEPKEVYSKYIIAEPFQWNRGYGISFIVESEIPLKDSPIGSKIKQIARHDYFDKDIDGELNVVFAPLFKGEIRGNYAEDIVWNIFYRLCKDEEWLKENFPDYIQYVGSL
mgnify:CR=1 FL=1